jgi:hypothetical protein
LSVNSEIRTWKRGQGFDVSNESTKTAENNDITDFVSSIILNLVVAMAH